MVTKILRDLVQRAESWPQNAQEELAQLALEIETELKGGHYRATPDELLGIDRGLQDAAEGKFATEKQVEASTNGHEDRLHVGGSRRFGRNSRLYLGQL
jgi:hypothetical protein